MLGEMTSRLCSIVALIAILALSSPPAAFAQSCQLTGGFALLQSQIPDVVGTCRGAELDRVELGEATQPTTNGRLIYHSLDGVVSFSDGVHTWVLDPAGQVQSRNVNERFPFEFN